MKSADSGQRPDAYLEGMIEGEKIHKMEFFLQYLRRGKFGKDMALLVDFGCANGEITKYLYTNMGLDRYDLRAVGYDINKSTLAGIECRNPNTEFTDEWSRVQTLVEECRKHGRIALTLSSIVHEFGSYLPEREHRAVWESIWDLQPDFIAIRDFLVCEHHDNASDKDDVAKIREKIRQERYTFTVGEHSGKNILDVWEETWGPIEEIRSMLHFLSMYRYLSKPEGDDELHEDHFSVPIYQLATWIPKQYRPQCLGFYTEPTQARAIADDFGIDVSGQPLNYKLVLQRVESDDEGNWTYDEFMKRAVSSRDLEN